MAEEKISQQMQVSGKFLRDGDVDPQLVAFGSGGPKALISFEKDAAGVIQVEITASGWNTPADLANALGQVALAVQHGNPVPADGN